MNVTIGAIVLWPLSGVYLPKNGSIKMNELGDDETNDRFVSDIIRTNELQVWPWRSTR